EAIGWSRRWLGLEAGEASLPDTAAAKRTPETKPVRDYWRKAFGAAGAISGTAAETYLIAARKLRPGPMIDVLHFAPRHPRRNGNNELEHHPALLALLSDIRT